MRLEGVNALSSDKGTDLVGVIEVSTKHDVGLTTYSDSKVTVLGVHLVN